MAEQWQRLARRVAGVLVLGTLVIGAAVPADAAADAEADGQASAHFVSPLDTGWNGT
jgi:hypothetical protein